MPVWHADTPRFYGLAYVLHIVAAFLHCLANLILNLGGNFWVFFHILLGSIAALCNLVLTVAVPRTALLQDAEIYTIVNNLAGA